MIHCGYAMIYLDYIYDINFFLIKGGCNHIKKYAKNILFSFEKSLTMGALFAIIL